MANKDAQGKSADKKEKEITEDVPGSMGIGDAYAPWPSEEGRVPPPFLTRMIQHNLEDSTTPFVTHLELMTLDRGGPTSPSLLTPGPQKPAVRWLLHASLLASCLVALLLITVEVIYLILGCVYLHMCNFIDIYFIISATFHLLIISLEWLRRWLSSITSHPLSRIRVDLFLFTSALSLVMFYIFSVVWYAVGFAWIMVPYTESLFNIQNRDEIVIVIQSTTVVYKQAFCSENFFHAAIFYQIFVLVVFLFRFMLFGFGDFCRGMCYKMANDNEAFNKMRTVYVANNLVDILPPISSQNRTPLINAKFGLFSKNIHGNVHCMIANIPQWKAFSV